MSNDVKEAPGIFKGAPVLVRGLQSAAEYNGSKGTVSSGLLDNGRYEVTIQLEGKREPKVLALKPANFQLDTEALKEYVMQKRAEASKRNPPLEDVALVWMKGKGLSRKALTFRTAEVPALQQGEILLRVDKFAFGHMALGYLMKGFTRSFAAYHDFYKYPEDGCYRSACFGYATVLESCHPKVEVGTRLYGLLPPCKFQIMPVGGIIPEGKNGERAIVQVTMEGIPYSLNRFQELEVQDGTTSSDTHMEDWRIVTRELYTMAFYMDEQLLVDTGMINSVIVSCASSKTALALAYCLRMREMRLVIGLTSKEHLEFVKSTDLFHEVYTYEEVESLPNSGTIVYMDFKCDSQLRHDISLRVGTNLMYHMVIGPSVFQKKMKDQLFEKKVREVIFDESSWRERRKIVNEVTKTDRNDRLKYSRQSFIERLQKSVRLRYISGTEAFMTMYDRVFNNDVSPYEAYLCTLHDNEFEGEELWDT